MPPSRHEDRVELSSDDLEEMISKGVERAFIRLGLDVKDPFEVQADFQHLRSWRKATEAMKGRTIVMLLTVVVTGLGIALWDGIRSFLHANN